jgi:hypothetical protein
VTGDRDFAGTGTGAGTKPDMRSFIRRVRIRGISAKMDSNQHFYTVWTHRSAQSIFGAASHPVVRNGELLCFATEERAQAECDRLNAGAGGSHVHYTVKPAYVHANSLASPEDGLALLSESFPSGLSARDG